MAPGTADRVVVVQSPNAGQARAQQLVGGVLDLLGDLGVGGTAVRWVVLEAAVLGRVVRRRDHDPIRLRAAASVMGEDRVGDRRCRRVAVRGIDRNLDAVRDQDLDCGAERRTRQRVRVTPQEQRPADSLRRAVPRDRIADGDDVRLRERAGQGAAPVARGPKGHRLRRVGGIRTLAVVGPDQTVDVNEHVRGGSPASLCSAHPIIVLHQDLGCARQPATRRILREVVVVLGAVIATTHAAWTASCIPASAVTVIAT